MYFLKDEDIDKEPVFEVSRYSDLYEYLTNNISYGSYDQKPEKISESELLKTETEIKSHLEKAKFRLVVGMAQEKDATELQGDFEYYEELVFMLGELYTLKKFFYNCDETLYCWIG